MKSTAYATLLALVAFALGLAIGLDPASGEDEPAAEPAPAVAPHVAVKKGEVALEEGFRAEHTKVALGDKLKGEASLEIRDWFGGKAITGQLDVENPTDASVFLSYHLAFFDKDGVLIGCATQNMEIEAGESTSIGGAVIQVPAAQLKQVASYQIAYYEDAKAIGQR
jgi:hypothetical protein